MPIAELWDLTGEVAIVTGGAAGMGRAIATRLDEAGAKVVVVDRNPDAPEIVAKYVPNAAVVVDDVSEPHNHADIVARAAEPFGTATILMNIAGIYPTVGFLDATAEFFDLNYQTNLRGLALMSVAFSRALIPTGRPGSIVNISSMDAIKPSLVSGLAPYAASKGGVLALTRHMAVELAEHRIAVNGIAPGTTLTDGVIAGMGVTDEASAREIIAPFAARIPMGRVAEPDDIARVALFLVSPSARYVRGQTIIVDGGSGIAAPEHPRDVARAAASS